MTRLQQILDLLKEIETDKDLDARSSALSFLSNELRAHQDRLDKEIFSTKPKFLPQDLREEMIGHLDQWDLDGVDGCEYCSENDRSDTPDEKLLEEYSDMVDGDEEEELLQKALGYQAELEMLSRGTVG